MISRHISHEVESSFYTPYSKYPCTIYQHDHIPSTQGVHFCSLLVSTIITNGIILNPMCKSEPKVSLHQQMSEK